MLRQRAARVAWKTMLRPHPTTLLIVFYSARFGQLGNPQQTQICASVTLISQLLFEPCATHSNITYQANPQPFGQLTFLLPSLFFSAVLEWPSTYLTLEQTHLSDTFILSSSSISSSAHTSIHKPSAQTCCISSRLSNVARRKRRPRTWHVQAGVRHEACLGG